MKSVIRPALALLAATLVVTGCAFEPYKDEKSAPGSSPYIIELTKGVAGEIGNQSYDPALGGYWLVSGTEATISMSLAKGCKVPGQFSFMLRTSPAASDAAPSELNLFKVLSPRYRIVTKFNPGKAAPVDIITPDGDVLVETDSTGKYIRFERVGKYVKVTFTQACLRDLMAPDAVVTWSGRKADAPKPVETWRRVVDGIPVPPPAKTR